MIISEYGLNLIKKFEGCVLRAYKDPVGVPTIGYGHTCGVKMGQTISREEANNLLKNDISTTYEPRVNKYNDVYHFTQSEFDALVSFAFNIGSIDQLTNNGKRTKQEIADKMLLYNKAGGKVLDGLTKRRQAERELFLTNSNTIIEVKKESEYNMPTIKLNSTGKAVKVWQVIIGTTIDGVFGKNTLEKTYEFQRTQGLKIDGIVGKNTWKVGLDNLS